MKPKKKRNFLTDHMEIYAESSPMAVAALLFVIVKGQLVTYLIFGSPLSGASLMGSTIVAILFVLSVIALKKRNKNTSEKSLNQIEKINGQPKHD